MLRVLRHSAGAVWRLLLLFAIAFSATLAACGGGSGELLTPATPATPGTPSTPSTPSTPTTPPAASSVVTGTAAMGAAIANTLVTLKDSTNKAVTTTTSTSGAFSLNSSSLTPPFMLQVTLPSGTKLLSVSTDANVTATINVTPLTDLVVRSWYNVQGRSADTAFANPTTLAPPSPAQVRTMAQVVLNNLQLAISANGAPVTDPLDLIAKPFTANGTGIDKLLDNSRVTVRSDGADLVLTAGSATQTTALAFSTTTSSITASSSTTSGSATTTVQSTEVVPVQGTQLTAVEQITAGMNAAAAVLSTKGANLTVADMEPFFDASLLDQGQTRTQVLTKLVDDFKTGGRTVAISIDRVLSLDLSEGRALIQVRFSQTAGGQTSVERSPNFFTRGADGQWRFGGDGRIGQVSLQAEGRRNQGLFTGNNGPSVNADVRVPQGLVTSVNISSTLNIVTMQPGSPEVQSTGILDVFFANTGPLTPPLPAAGLPVIFTLNKAAGGTVEYTQRLNAFTTELIQVTQPTGTTIGTGTATVTWTLPTTYAVERTQLTALVFTGDQTKGLGFQCIVETTVSATATSGTIDIPATCNGQPVLTVNLNVATNGFNGERSLVVYGLTKQ